METLITLANSTFRLEQGEGRISSISTRLKKMESSIEESKQLEESTLVEEKKLVSHIESLERDLAKVQDKTKMLEENARDKWGKSSRERSSHESSGMLSRIIAIEDEIEYIKKRIYR